MAHIHEFVTFAQSRIMDLNIVSEDYAHIVRIISWIFITLGLASFLPIASLIVFDFFLWLWRLTQPKPLRRRQRRESLSHPVTT